MQNSEAITDHFTCTSGNVIYCITFTLWAKSYPSAKQGDDKATDSENTFETQKKRKGAVKQVSAGVALCNMVGFVNMTVLNFRCGEVSRKVELLSIFATVKSFTVQHNLVWSRSVFLRYANQKAEQQILRPASTLPSKFRPLMSHGTTSTETYFAVPLHMF